MHSYLFASGMDKLLLISHLQLRPTEYSHLHTHVQSFALSVLLCMHLLTVTRAGLLQTLCHQYVYILCVMSI